MDKYNRQRVILVIYFLMISLRKIGDNQNTLGADFLCPGHDIQNYQQNWMVDYSGVGVDQKN